MNVSILSAAREIILCQDEVPKSPGNRVLSGYSLCLGAALVDAANIIRGVSQTQRDKARIRMTSGSSPDSILQEARLAEVNPEVCLNAIVHNDSLPDVGRRFGALKWLNEFDSN